MPRCILDIYSAYYILPNLQEHQLRVAAVAKVIGEAQKAPLELQPLIEACLLHDMGNILKINIRKPLFPEHIKPRGIAYWEKIQEEIRGKYGPNEHIATQYHPVRSH
jgi:5'-deoxynucleotidase YfbR-like HD superfamily hydrolase